MSEINILSSKTSENIQNSRKKILQLFNNAPIPDSEIMRNLGLFLNPGDLKKILFKNLE